MFDFKKRKNLFLLMAAFSVPLNLDQWEMLKFSNIKANTLHASNGELVIGVNQSSSPLIHKFKTPVRFTRVVATGEIKNGTLNLKDREEQGVFIKKSITDDYTLRLGLILDGKTKKPNFFSFLFLPRWAKRLFKLAPRGAGYDKVHFLNVVHNKKDIGKTRTHPLHRLLFEEGAAHARTGEFKIDKTFESSKLAYGLWLSSSGNGTKSQYDTVIKSIEFY